MNRVDRRNRRKPENQPLGLVPVHLLNPSFEFNPYILIIGLHLVYIPNHKSAEKKIHVSSPPVLVSTTLLTKDPTQGKSDIESLTQGKSDIESLPALISFFNTQK